MFEEEKVTKTKISASTQVKGNLFSQDDIIIEGMVIGKVITSGNLEVKKGAKIKANLEAENIIIAGKVEGNIKAKEKIEIIETSEIYGNIYSKKFLMVAGAIFIGECKTGERKKTEIEKVIKEEDFEKMTSEEEVTVEISEGIFDI